MTIFCHAPSTRVQLFDRLRVTTKSPRWAHGHFIMVELATKADLLVTEQKLRTSIGELHTDLRTTEQKLQTSIIEVRTDLRATEQRLQNSIDNLSLRLTVRLGVLIAAGIGALAAILKLA